MPNKNEYFKTLLLDFKYNEKSVESFSNSISAAFESSSIGKILASGFSAALMGGNPIQATFETFLEEFSQIVGDAIDRLDTILRYSKMSDRDVRELKLAYGFSSSEAYGYQTAMGVMGFESLEDLMYANEQELSQFREAFDKYSDYYTQLYDSGYFEKLQEYQIEMAEFKLDMEHTVVEFFVDNKDIIIRFMNILIDASEMIMESLGQVIDFFDDVRDALTLRRENQSTLNQYSTTSAQTNVSQTNNFNVNDSKDPTWLANAGQMVYLSTIKALEA